jgi:hypothetical protein
LAGLGKRKNPHRLNFFLIRPYGQRFQQVDLIPVNFNLIILKNMPEKEHFSLSQNSKLLPEPGGKLSILKSKMFPDN